MAPRLSHVLSRRGALVVASAMIAISAACHDNATEPSRANVVIALQAPGDSLFIGKRLRIVAAVTSDSLLGEASKVAWSSSDTTFAVVDTTGMVTAAGIGSATISASIAGRTSSMALRVVLRRADGGVVFTDGSSGSGFVPCALSSGVVYCRAAVDSGYRFTKQAGAAGLVFTSLSTSSHAICGLDPDGRALCWGTNSHFLLARSAFTTNDTGPAPVGTTLRFSAIAHGGHAQTCGISRADSVTYCWGHNDAYQLMHGDKLEDTIIRPVTGSLRASAVGTTEFASCLIDLGGSAYCSGGLNFSRRVLGVEDADGPAETPMRVVGGLQFRLIAPGLVAVCALTRDNDAYCWGRNDVGPSLGNGSLLTPSTLGPQRVVGELKFTSLVTVASSACGITTTNALYCWGPIVRTAHPRATDQQLTLPIAMAPGYAFKALVTSVNAVCAITLDGKIYCM